MRENDIALDIDALDSTFDKIKRHMDSIGNFARQLCVNMNVVNKEFDSANFEHAEQIINDVMSKLSFASDRIQKVRAYLRDVEQKIAVYLKCKYV